MYGSGIRPCRICNNNNKARGDIENEELETENEFKRKNTQERKANWKENVMH